MEIRLLAYSIVILGSINLLRMAIFLIGSDIYSLLQAKRKKKLIKYLPKISVVIPAYNEKGTILRAMRSVLGNNYPRKLLELVVVDDGSIDGTAKIVESFIKSILPNSIEHINLLVQKNSGKAAALNNGIKRFCTGELIMCLDADSFLDKKAIRNAVSYFADSKVAALSANIKIIKRRGLLNLVQIYEYLICYQMKRAESLLNCEYIVGGIGSIFRRSILDKVNYYDTNTVTEDIDLTMKILQLGNRENKVLYGSDVVAYTGSVLSIKDLLKQRYRWKWGRSQTFFKNLNMFFSPERKFSKTLSWFYLPFAIYGDMAYVIEPILLGYILAISIYYQNFISIISAWAVISIYVLINIFAEDTLTLKEKIKLSIGAPFMYVLFYILNFAEYVALLKAVKNLSSLKESLNENKCEWIPVERPYGISTKISEAA